MPEGSGFPWPGGARAAVSLSFDDARESQLQTGLPVLERHGLRATFYVSPGAMRKRYAGWRRAAQMGHELGNHTMTHPCSANFAWARGNALEDFTPERMERELALANAEIEQVAGKPPVTFAYPCGQTFLGRGKTHQSYVPIVAKSFLAGRGFLWETHNHPALCDFGHLAGIWCDGIGLDGFTSWLDGAVKDGGWVIFAGHDVGTDGGRQTTRADVLDSFCALLMERRAAVWTATVADVAAHVRAVRAGA